MGRLTDFWASRGYRGNPESEVMKETNNCKNEMIRYTIAYPVPALSDWSVVFGMSKNDSVSSWWKDIVLIMKPSLIETVKMSVRVFWIKQQWAEKMWQRKPSWERCRMWNNGFKDSQLSGLRGGMWRDGDCRVWRCLWGTRKCRCRKKNTLREPLIEMWSTMQDTMRELWDP